MWESNKVWVPTEYAYETRDQEYKKCWADLPDRADLNMKVYEGNGGIEPYPFVGHTK